MKTITCLSILLLISQLVSTTKIASNLQSQGSTLQSVSTSQLNSLGTFIAATDETLKANPTLANIENYARTDFENQYGQKLDKLVKYKEQIVSGLSYTFVYDS